MKIRYLPFLFVLFSAALALSDDAMCGTPTTAKVKAKKCLFPKSRKRAPNWVCGAKVDGLPVTAVGFAAKSGAGVSFMEQMASADARIQLVRNLSSSVQKNMSGNAKAAHKGSVEGDNALITKITDESLQGTKVIKRAYGPKGTLYVLVGLDESSAKKLNESITADYMQQKSK